MAESSSDDDAITVKRVVRSSPSAPAQSARPLRVSGPMQPPPGAPSAPTPPPQPPSLRAANAQQPAQQPIQLAPKPQPQPRTATAMGGFIVRQSGQAQAPQIYSPQPYYPVSPQTQQWPPIPIVQPPQPLPRAPQAPPHTHSVGGFLLLDPTQFEEYVAQLLRADGHQHVRRQGGAGDLNVDIACMTPRGEYMVVQCKRFKPGHTVGSPVIQTFIGMVQVHHHAQSSMVVTTSTFTKQAKALARQHNIILVNGEQLVQWANRISRGHRL